MRLEVYFETYGIKKVWFAKKAKISPQTLSRILRGEIPTMQTAEKIEKASGGVVRIRELMPDA